MAIKSLTIEHLAEFTLDLQRAKDLPSLLCSWADMAARIRQLLPEATLDEINRHPINVLLARKVAELSGDGSEIESTRAFYACKTLAESATPLASVRTS